MKRLKSSHLKKANHACPKKFYYHQREIDQIMLSISAGIQKIQFSTAIESCFSVAASAAIEPPNPPGTAIGAGARDFYVNA
jgi:hypothetical protein